MGTQWIQSWKQLLRKGAHVSWTQRKQVAFISPLVCPSYCSGGSQVKKSRCQQTALGTSSKRKIQDKANSTPLRNHLALPITGNVFPKVAQGVSTFSMKITVRPKSPRCHLHGLQCEWCPLECCISQILFLHQNMLTYEL